MEYLRIFSDQMWGEYTNVNETAGRLGINNRRSNSAGRSGKDAMGGVAVTSVRNGTSLALVAVPVGQANYCGESLKETHFKEDKHEDGVRP